MDLGADRSSPRIRIRGDGDILEFWPEEPFDKAGLYRIIDTAKAWGFPPDHQSPRPATDEEVRGLDELPGAAKMLRERGIVWYEAPLRIRRDRDQVEGRAFDDLCQELAKVGPVVSLGQLAEIARKVRLRNLPAGQTARHWLC